MLNSSSPRKLARRVFGSLCVAGSLASGALAAAAPAAPHAAGGPPGYEIIRLGRGHNNRLCLAASINGIKGLFMLDTGANGTALNQATYGSLLKSGIPLPNGLPKTTSFNGVTVPVAVVPDFHVGKSNLGNLPVVMVPNRFLYDVSIERGADNDRRYDGLLGEDILRHCNAMVDCGRLAVYLNTGPSRKLTVDAGFVSAGWTRVPMSDVHRDFTVPCTINDHHFRLLVDTGAPFTTMNRNLLQAAHLELRDIPGLRGGLVGTRAEDSGYVAISGMQIGNYVAPTVHVVSTPQSFAQFGGPNDQLTDGAIVGLLGGDVLAANGAVVDIGNKVLYLKRSGGNTAR